jgi:N-succinyldiaminopimelate aminotransferase
MTSQSGTLPPGIPSSGLAALANGAVLSPFTQLRRLLGATAAGHTEPIDMTIGEPREAMPPFVVEKLIESASGYASYPPIRGTAELRGAISAWAGRRYGAAAALDPDREVLPINGSREGLFLAAVPAAGRKPVQGRPAILMCNPYYSAYIGGALAANAEPVFLNATQATGHLPDLEALAADKALLVALYLCSPANPQGAVAGDAYIARALGLAREHDFTLFFDECYSELYTAAPPTGALQVAVAAPERFANFVVFNSLSKRSNLPGLRSGFWPATIASSRRSPRSATWSRRRCRGRRSTSPPPCGRTRRTSRPIAKNTGANSRSATAFSAADTVTAGRPAGSSSGSM